MTLRHGYRRGGRAKYNYVRSPVRHRENTITRVINGADCVRVHACMCMCAYMSRAKGSQSPRVCKTSGACAREIYRRRRHSLTIARDPYAISVDDPFDPQWIIARWCPPHRVIFTVTAWTRNEYGTPRGNATRKIDLTGMTT